MNATTSNLEIANTFHTLDEASVGSISRIGSNPWTLGQTELVFAVSRDEEHVEIQARIGERTIAVGQRAHNYLLLTLARQRISDAANGLPQTSCGWMCREDVEHDPMMSPPRFNIDVFRIRRRFAAYGIVDAYGIIERRLRAQQFRIGVERLSVIRI